MAPFAPPGYAYARDSITATQAYKKKEVLLVFCSSPCWSRANCAAVWLTIFVILCL